MLKRFVIILMALALALACVAAGAEAFDAYIGVKLDDFSVETTDGMTFSLYEALADHELALINLWATWCPYCIVEFPHLQEAYAQYSDRVSVVALSVEPDDTLEMMRATADEMSLTFPIASDAGVGLADMLGVQGIPTSVLVDQEGRILYVVEGAMPSVEAFTEFFDEFLGEGA